MIKDAEKFSDDDKKTRERVEARNDLESYSYNLKNQLADKDKLGSKLADDEKSTIEAAIEQAINFLDNNQEADTEALKKAKKELEDVVQPIIAKLYQGQGPPPTADGAEEDLRDEL